MDKAQNKASYSKSFIFDIIGYFPSKFVPIIISFLWSYIFTRVFSPEEYGLYGLVIAITGPAVTVLVEWAAQPLGRFYNEYKAENKLDVYYKLLRLLTRIVFFLSIVTLLVSLFLVTILKKEYLILVIPGGLTVIFNALTSVYMPILPASLDIKSFRKIQILKNLFRLVIAVILVFGFSKNILFLMWADTIAAILFLFPLLKIVNNKINIKKIQATSDLVNSNIKKFLNYGIPMMLWFFASQLLNVGDRFVIQHYLGDKTVGIYTANYLLVNGVSGLLNAPIALAAFPLIMKQWTEKDETGIQKTIKNMTTIYAIIALAIVGETYVLAKPIVEFSLGTEYLEGYGLLPPLVIGLVVWQASMLGHKGMELKENTRIMVYLILLSALLNLFLNIFLVPKFGYEAAAWTTLLCYFLYAFLIWLLSSSYIKWSIDIKVILPCIIFTYISISITNSFDIGTFYLNIVIKSILFLAVYAFMMTCWLKFAKINIKE